MAVGIPVRVMRVGPDSRAADAARRLVGLIGVFRLLALLPRPETVRYGA